jgi:Tfp pilus assembly protein PilX
MTPETSRAGACAGPRRRRESGAALLISILLLTAMALIGFASLNTVMRDREVTGYTSQSQTALYGADAALANSLEVIRTEIVGNQVLSGDCLAAPVPSATLPNGVSYGPDTTATTPNICMLAAAEPCEEMASSINVGEPIYLYTIWNVRTQGVAPGGATARIQATAERCHAFND